MRLVQLVQCIKCGGDSYLPIYFPLPLLAQLCCLPWSFTFQCKELHKVFPGCLCSSGSSIGGLVCLLFSDLSFTAFVYFEIILTSSLLELGPRVRLWLTYMWIFNHPQTGAMAKKCAQIITPTIAPKNSIPSHFREDGVLIIPCRSHTF